MNKNFDKCVNRAIELKKEYVHLSKDIWNLAILLYSKHFYDGEIHES